MKMNIALTLLAFLICSPNPWAAEAQTTCTQITQNDIQQTVQFCEQSTGVNTAIDPLLTQFNNISGDFIDFAFRECCDRLRTFLGSTCQCSPVPGLVIPQGFRTFSNLCGFPARRIWQCDEVCGSVTPVELEEIAPRCTPSQVPVGLFLTVTRTVVSNDCCTRLNPLNFTCLCTRDSAIPQNILTGARACTDITLPQVGQCRP